jgi:hypothetical protein
LQTFQVTNTFKIITKSVELGDEKFDLVKPLAITTN